MEQKILVAVDFTEVSHNAIDAALDIADPAKDTVLLLHIIASESDRAEAEYKIKSLVESHTHSGVKISTLVVEGSVLKDIGKIAESAAATLVIFGTHGVHGFQKMFGSNALKVVSHTKVPLLIVQKKVSLKSPKHIVMTIDLERDSVQVVKAAASLAERFKSKIHLVAGRHEDPQFKSMVSVNLNVCKEYLTRVHVDHEVHLLEREHFVDHLFQLCHDIHAELLAATYYPDTINLFSAKFVEGLVNNRMGIPVITIDAENTGAGSQFSFIAV